MAISVSLANFRASYLALGSLLALLAELNTEGIITRPRPLSSGRNIGGVRFTRGSLAYLLKNRTYIGDINHRGKSYPGEHQAIVDPSLFDAVQAKLAENLQVHRTKRAASHALLLGKFVDDCGNVMTPTHSSKRGVRYHYYISRALVEGRPRDAGSIPRVSAGQIEAKVVEALRAIMEGRPRYHGPEGDGAGPHDAQSLVQRMVDRIVLKKDHIVIGLVNELAESLGQVSVRVPWIQRPGKPKREVIPSSIATGNDKRPIRSETRSTLLRALAMGRLWLQELVTEKTTDTGAIALREERSKRSVHMMISLAFVAPDVVEAAVSGRLPRGIGITRLVDLPSIWSKQREALGLSARA